MILITRVFFVFCGLASIPGLLATPVEGVEGYFTAIENGDKDLLRDSVDAPGAYKNQFVKIIDVTSRLALLADLLNTKYDVAPENRKGPRRYLQALSKDVLNRKFTINGEHAESVPEKDGEVPVPLVLADGKWRLDLRRGQSDEELQRQARLLGRTYDGMIALLNGLIQKIDTLDTAKHSYENAWKMIDIQMERTLKSVIEQEGESGGNGE